MRHISWLMQRGVAATAAMALLIGAVAIASAGCGLFGDDDEQPQVVQPPPTTQQTAETQTPAQQQQSTPTQAVAVTTAPDADDQEQSAQPASEDAQEPQAEVPSDVYIVQAGDTLAEIAAQFDVRVDDLITLNGIQNPDVLQVGQQLRIPVAEEAVRQDAEQQQAEEEEQESEQEDEQIEAPEVTLPTVAVPAATPTTVTWSQFPQPDADVTTDTIPDAPTSFLQYGAAALPWLHGIDEVEPIIDLFRAWPMPALAVGNDRVVLVDTNDDGAFAVSIIYTDPSTFGAAVPHSNLVVYDPVPGAPSSYRIGYDHAQAYAREVQGLQQLSDVDVSGDGRRDLTFRELTCDSSGCVSSFYVLSSTADGYRTITAAAAQVAEVSAITIADRSGDGIPDIVVEGLAADEAVPSRYRFVFVAQGDALVESLRIALDSDEVLEEDEDDGFEE